MRWLLAILWCAVNLAAEENPAVSFSRDVAPVFLRRCAECHGAEKAKGGYRLHTVEAAGQAGKSGETSLVPGDPSHSELFRRLVTDDPDDRMPQEGDPLPAPQVELIRRWIAEGAKLDQGTAKTPLAQLIPRADQPMPPEKYARPIPVLSLAFNADGSQLAASGYHEVTLWGPAGELQRRLTNVTQRVRSLAYQPAGLFLAVAGGVPGRAGESSIYHLATGQIETNLVRAPDEMLAAAWSADGKWFATAGTDHTIHLFSAPSSEQTGFVKRAAIQQHADWVTALSFNSEGTQLLSASRDRTARICLTENGGLEASYMEHSAPVFAAAFLPEGLAVSGGRGKSLHLWEAKEGKKKREIGGLAPEVRQVIASGESLFVAPGGKEAIRFKISDGSVERRYEGHSDAIFAIAYHPGASRLAAGAYDGTVKIWNAQDGALQASFIAAPGFAAAR